MVHILVKFNHSGVNLASVSISCSCKERNSLLDKFFNKNLAVWDLRALSPDWVSWILRLGKKCVPRYAWHPSVLYPTLASPPESHHIFAHRIQDHRLYLWMEHTVPLLWISSKVCVSEPPPQVANLHLLVSCARRTFSEENVSSRSNRSSMGGGRSLKAGGKTWKAKHFKLVCFIFFSILRLHVTVELNDVHMEKHWLQQEWRVETYWRLKLGQWGFKLWCDQLKWLVFDIKLLVGTGENEMFLYELWRKTEWCWGDNVLCNSAFLPDDLW